MDYKQKYEEALERAREYWETDNDNTLDIKAKGTMEYLFPELAMSEDALTWLKTYIEEEAYYLSMDIRDEEDRIKLKKLQNAFVWLEKQGQKKPVNDTDEDIVEAVKDTSILDMIEQKPTWSEEDERAFHHVLSVLEEYGEEHPSKSKFVCNWLKSIKVKMGGDKV